MYVFKQQGRKKCDLPYMHAFRTSTELEKDSSATIPLLCLLNSMKKKDRAPFRVCACVCELDTHKRRTGGGGGWVDGVTSGLTCAITPSDAVWTNGATTAAVSSCHPR